MCDSWGGWVGGCLKRGRRRLRRLLGGWGSGWLCTAGGVGGGDGEEGGGGGNVIVPPVSPHVQWPARRTIVQTAEKKNRTWTWLATSSPGQGQCAEQKLDICLYFCLNYVTQGPIYSLKQGCSCLMSTNAVINAGLCFTRDLFNFLSASTGWKWPGRKNFQHFLTRVISYVRSQRHFLIIPKQVV